MSVAELPPTAGGAEALYPCNNCGESGVRNYCPGCGETRPGHEDMSLSHFFGHAVHELVHLDSKIFRSFLYLITRPGFLTAEYFNGRKKRYIAPLRIYVTLFALSFFAYSFQSSISVWDVQKFIDADVTGKIAGAIEQLTAGTGVSASAWAEQVNVNWHKLITVTQFVNILLLALALQALYWRSGRYFVEHLIFSLHLQSAFLLISLLMWPLWWLAGVQLTDTKNYGLSLTMMLVHAVIAIVAVHRFYAQDRWRNLIKGFAGYIASYAASVVLTLATLVMAVYVVSKAIRP